MLNKLPDTARVWVFQANRILSDSDQALMHHHMQKFIPDWAAHGKGLSGDYEVAENLFLIVGVDESRALASGCSIDSLTHKVKEIGALIDVDFFDRMAIAHVTNEGKIELVGMGHFRNMMQSDEVGYGTTVFNNLVDNKKDLLENWKTKVKDSWHKNILDIL